MASELQVVTDSIRIVSLDTVEFTDGNPAKYRVGPDIGVQIGEVGTVRKVHTVEAWLIGLGLGKRQEHLGEHVDVESSGRHHYAMTLPRPFLGPEPDGPFKFEPGTPSILPAAASQNANLMTIGRAAFSGIFAPPTTRSYGTALTDQPISPITRFVDEENVYPPNQSQNPTETLERVSAFIEHIKRYGTQISG